MPPDFVSPVALQHTQEVTCTPPWYVQDTEYPPAAASYQPLVNGEVAFKAVYLAIASAKKSIEILCWGFQPSMYFIRDGKTGLRIGELLMNKAKEGVEVRVLGWEMPFNSAGVADEANLPGKGPISIADRAGQSATQDQYAYDREWFATCAVPDNMVALRAKRSIPVFVGRGFSREERVEIAFLAKHTSLDRQLSLKTIGALAATASHHQKTVLVDFELTDQAVGFVMGHNMLDEYWDTDAHSALNRTENTKPAPDAGPRGNTPRQDISSQVSGPIVEHLHHNFATAWRKETGEDLLVSRQAKEVGPQLCTLGLPQVAQILRTQPQEGKRDIEQLYLQAINNATQFIYIENQYFRWPPLAEFIKAVASSQARAGRDPALHGSLHLFVITNATDDGMGKGTVNTQRMLESLGRGETIPELTKLRRIEQAKAQSAAAEPDLGDLLAQKALVTLTSITDSLGGGHASDKAREAQEETARNNRLRLADLNDRIKAIEESPVKLQTFPNLKVHVCSLVAPDSPAGKPWMPVYIHSKLMIVNDVFTTHGSANINTRSMQVDSELNIAHDWASVTKALRRQLWSLHTAMEEPLDDPAGAFKAWKRIIRRNKRRQNTRKGPCAPLVEFYYDKTTMMDLD
ncbi:phosphatidylserine/phosphatidylglycerophosphate/cardiolipin synthase family protein [Pseudomonas sp. L13]|uniref:phospholipase D-like domain-containing protein n=1 Tax=Pseudomonas sp. L13 TaxID=343985 RepID=UPI00137A6230|nr:phosphatidylserine/phosphatidylglycerophosphate/cardiolipin synthase family protein [Pseudomonas sp. L13]NCE90628.1 phospholipase [Pseudomonas sp. L13]